MNAKLRRSPWVCPNCGRQFVSANRNHSCGRYNLEDHFEGKEPIVRGLYHLLLDTLEQFGPVGVYPVKTRIIFQAQVQFVAAMPRKRWLDGYIWLRRQATHPRILRMDRGVFRDYGHMFRLGRLEDLDDDLVHLLQEAYVLGCQISI